MNGCPELSVNMLCFNGTSLYWYCASRLISPDEKGALGLCCFLPVDVPWHRLCATIVLAVHDDYCRILLSQMRICQRSHRRDLALPHKGYKSPLKELLKRGQHRYAAQLAKTYLQIDMRPNQQQGKYDMSLRPKSSRTFGPQ